MTIYVDNAGIPATVTDPATGRRYRSRWCHLFSSETDPTELHAFAASIGLRRAWFQPGTRLNRPDNHDPAGDHYDLTAGKRRQALAAGAIAVTPQQAVVLWQTKRNAVRHHTTAPRPARRRVGSLSATAASARSATGTPDLPQLLASPVPRVKG